MNDRVSIRVGLVDDHASVRLALADLLRLEDDIEIAFEAPSGYDAILLADKIGADIILMDLRMPGINGVQATREILMRHPDIRVLLFTTFDEGEMALEAIEAGASGYLLKDTPIDDLISAIRLILPDGSQKFDVQISASIKARVRPFSSVKTGSNVKFMTSLDYDLLSLLCAGKCESAIAECFRAVVRTKEYDCSSRGFPWQGANILRTIGGDVWTDSQRLGSLRTGRDGPGDHLCLLPNVVAGINVARNEHIG